MSHSDALHRLLTAATVPALPLLRGGLVTGFDGTVLNACGLAVRLGDAVAVGRQRRPGEVIGFAGGTTQILGLANLAGVAPGDAVVPLPAASDVAVGPALLGRVIDGLGRPLDGRGPIMASARRPAQAPPLNPADRARVTQPLATGVKVLDGLLTFGQGQRIGIMAGTGVGKSVLLGQITRWADADVVVMALIGERGREITDFIETELNGPARARTVTVAVPADEAPLLRLRGADRAFAIAEHFRDAGQRVLLILDSFSRVVMAARDIAFARGESSGGRAYPPSALGLIPRLCERAGGDRRTGGCITLVATVLAESDDRADPVVDAARGVMDGHVLLQRRLAGAGLFPAVDVLASASRVMPDCVAPPQLAAAARLRGWISLIEENRDLVLMGAYAPGADAELDRALGVKAAIEAFRRQPRHQRADWDDTRRQLLALTGEAG